VIYRLMTGLMAVLLLAGCQSLSERKQADSLQEVLRNYEATIRWGAVDQARQFLKPEAMETVQAAPVAPMRVTHYEVVQGPSMIADGKAIQTALIQYVFVDSQVVRELVDQQTWEFDSANQRWYLASPLPSFK